MSTVEIKTEFGRSSRKNALVIVNPRAGNMRALEMISPVIEALSNKGYAPLSFTTTCRGDATRLASEYGMDCSLLVVIGGDGTMNEAVRGVMTIDKKNRPVIGFIPTGSTNDFAAALGLPKRADLLIKTALDGVPTEIDVGSFNGRHYAYLASFGAFTDISYSTPQAAKNALGFLAYLGGNMMTSIANIRPIGTSVVIGGNIISDEFAFVSVSNTPSVVGIIKYDKEVAMLSDGMFEVMLINYPDNAIKLGKLAHALTTGDYESCELMHVFTANDVKFILDEPVNWMLDGELVESGHQVRITNVHSAVRIMLPDGKQALFSR